MLRQRSWEHRTNNGTRKSVFSKTSLGFSASDDCDDTAGGLPKTTRERIVPDLFRNWVKLERSSVQWPWCNRRIRGMHLLLLGRVGDVYSDHLFSLRTLSRILFTNYLLKFDHKMDFPFRVVDVFFAQWFFCLIKLRVKFGQKIAVTWRDIHLTRHIKINPFFSAISLRWRARESFITQPNRVTHISNLWLRRSSFVFRLPCKYEEENIFQDTLDILRNF